MKQQDKLKMKRYSVKDFRKQFPTDDACLEWLKDYLYPEGIFCKTCNKITTHHKVASRRSYSCQFCGHHVHPTAGTIYHKSTTPLTDWFYAVFLMASTRCGISAKQLERELGCTYKTAWRMFNLIRSMLNDDKKLSGVVEVDEAYIGSNSTRRHRIKNSVVSKRGRGSANKSIIVGAVERQGSVISKVIENVKTETLIPFVKKNVEPNTMVYTDEWRSYRKLPKHGYQHDRIRHGIKAWVVGDVHTNTIEGFWSLVKNGIRGAYKGRVTRKHLQSYVNEFAFRYNRRFDETPMFLSFLMQTRKADG